jgi:hypothetical protein
MYISFNDGDTWQSLQLNLPQVPITDLAIKNDNLIAATQGRSFWMIDDLTVFHQMSDEIANSEVYLFKPMDSYRMGGGNGATSKTAGTNHPGGVLVHYYLKDTSAQDTIALSFREPDGTIIKTFSTHPNQDENESKLEPKPGLNQLNWNMRYEGAKTFPGMIMWWATTQGPIAAPGNYQVVMNVNNQEMEQSFALLKDPRVSSSQEDLEAQFEFLIKVRDKLTETHEAIINIRKVRGQINDVIKKSDGNEAITAQGKEILEKIKTIEEALYQTKNESNQDPLNFPIRLNNKLGHLGSLMGVGDFRPTDQAEAFYGEVTAAIDEYLVELDAIFEKDIKAFNETVYQEKIEAVKLED